MIAEMARFLLSADLHLDATPLFGKPGVYSVKTVIKRESPAKSGTFTQVFVGEHLKFQVKTYLQSVTVELPERNGSNEVLPSRFMVEMQPFSGGVSTGDSFIETIDELKLGEDVEVKVKQREVLLVSGTQFSSIDVFVGINDAGAIGLLDQQSGRSRDRPARKAGFGYANRSSATSSFKTTEIEPLRCDVF